MIKRAPKRVKEIDKYIKEHYPIDGPDKVAEVLEESRDYIQQRAWYLRIKMNSRKKAKPKAKAGTGSKLKKLEEERDYWRRKYHAERIRNAQLRGCIDYE